MNPRPEFILSQLNLGAQQPRNFILFQLSALPAPGYLALQDENTVLMYDNLKARAGRRPAGRQDGETDGTDGRRDDGRDGRTDGGTDGRTGRTDGQTGICGGGGGSLSKMDRQAVGL